MKKIVECISVNHIYIATSMLDLSKVLMQDFHCNYIKIKCVDKAELLLIDTDSLLYKTEAKNVYEFFFEIIWLR